MKTRYFDLVQRNRLWVLLVLYSIELTASLWLAYELRFDFMVDSHYREERLFVLFWLIPLQLLLLGLFQQLTPLLGYFSTPDLARMLQAMAISAIAVSAIWIGW